jgi:hypothetical protein
MGNSYKYLGGLPQGKPGEDVEITIERGDLVFEHIKHKGAWGGLGRQAERQSLHLSTLGESSVMQHGEHVSAGRVIATGAVGLFWKKGDLALVLPYELNGVKSTALIGGKRDALEALNQTIMSARMAGASAFKR